MKSFLISLALLLASVSAQADRRALPVSAVTIAHPYSHPTAAPGVPGVGFFTLTNTAKKADRLLSVTSPAAGSVEIHQSAMQNGVMQMRALSKGLLLPPGKPVALAPGAIHLMLFDLKAPLLQGQAVPVTLTFAHAGPVTTALQVEPREQPTPEPVEDHSHHQHH